MPGRLLVIAHDPVLSHALVGHLQRATERLVIAERTPANCRATDVVVGASSSLTPEDCLAIAQAGAVAVILAALPNAGEERAYTTAGAAAYLPMAVHGSTLADVVAAIMASAP